MPCVTPETIPDRLSTEDVHAALHSRLRRQLLAELHRAGRPQSLDELAERIVDEPAASDEERLREIRVQLYHVHVPYLADVGYVDTDDATDAVTLTESGRAVAALLVE